MALGDYVREGTPLFRLNEDDPIELHLPIPERHRASLKLGLEAEVRSDAFSGVVTGLLHRIHPEINVKTRTFTVEVILQNAEHRLVPGSFARAWIKTHTDQEAVFVPESAVVSFAGIQRVYLADSGKAKEQIVDASEPSEGIVEVRSGLKAGIEVIVENAGVLYQGAAIRVLPGKDDPKGALPR